MERKAYYEETLCFSFENNTYPTPYNKPAVQISTTVNNIPRSPTCHSGNEKGTSRQVGQANNSKRVPIRKRRKVIRLISGSKVGRGIMPKGNEWPRGTEKAGYHYDVGRT
ncbi:hypothetical protein BofuT4_P135880.1 [Botrytis cinerea T4]|uniref:Uncharacterized protein n=1 Tax=Botryotinia fuckeliana (strain T4) TaxID=999810 RepID=G2YPJ5_BOTF4|nr:hypothetical protein BofuT4_P135880.1 [Botrytis cinerea T4]